MNIRTSTSYQTLLYDFIKCDILVVCPECTRKALVKTADFSLSGINNSDIKIICTQCGFNKRLTEKPATVLYSSPNNTIKGNYIITGRPIDPFFYFPLWLKTNFGENILWAYNIEHLHFLRNHIAATLRERNGQELQNKSLGSRLPKWMTSKKNRVPLLKKISILETMSANSVQ